MKTTFHALVRLGYFSKALVYLVMGVLALRVATGVRGGRITDPGGALYVVLGQPLGNTLLLLVAAGLLTYAAWEIGRGIFGWGRVARDGIGSRAMTCVRGLFYGALGVQATKLAIGLRGDETGPEPLVRAALKLPLGDWVILAVGLGVGIYGVIQIISAIKGRLEVDLDAATIRRRAGEWALHVARGGIGARGVLLVLIATGVVRAALKHRASAAGGFDTSLLILNALPQGPLLLGLAAAGVLAYGIYQLLHARYADLSL